MIIVSALLASFAIVRFGPALLASFIATILALVMIRRSRTSTAALIAAGPRRAKWNRTSRAERRLLAVGLDAAVNMATFTSLMPASVFRASALQKGFGRLAG